MCVVIGGQIYEVAEHIWRDHPERIGQVTIDQIRQTILEPERTGPGKYDRILYWRWFAELSDRGNYLRVIVDEIAVPHVVVSAMPDKDERRRRRGGRE